MASPRQEYLKSILQDNAIMTFVPQEIIGLIERFDANHEAYQSGVYNETQLRREFIDPFFKALGWDVDNEKGYAEAYKDVIHEDSIKVGGPRTTASASAGRANSS